MQETVAKYKGADKHQRNEYDTTYTEVSFQLFTAQGKGYTWAVHLVDVYIMSKRVKRVQTHFLTTILQK